MPFCMICDDTLWPIKYIFYIAVHVKTLVTLYLFPVDPIEASINGGQLLNSTTKGMIPFVWLNSFLSSLPCQTTKL